MGRGWESEQEMRADQYRPGREVRKEKREKRWSNCSLVNMLSPPAAMSVSSLAPLWLCEISCVVVTFSFSFSFLRGLGRLRVSCDRLCHGLTRNINM
jgi:hypothetical protein